MELTLRQIAAICGGQVVAAAGDDRAGGGGPGVATASGERAGGDGGEGVVASAGGDPADVVISGASIDSREIVPGQLFVPLVAARDGHDFIDAAARAGAAATLLARDDLDEITIPGVVVDDTAEALRALGEWAAQSLKGRGVTIVGITGSVGKTTVKDLAVAALATKHAHANVRSFNNEIGVPLTLLATPPDASVVVLEMGARGIGHIAELCAIAPPDVGVVTTVGAVHTSEFGSIDGVVEAKGELVEALPPNGVAVLNAEVPEVAAMRDRTEAQVCTFGTGGDVWASEVTLNAALEASFVAHHRDDQADVTLTVAGRHQVANALAALAVAVACDVSLREAAAGLAQTELSPWRMEMHETNAGGVVINDAYNANSLSMKAAIDALAALDATTRVAVLGTMAELGDRHDADHRDIANYARSRGIRVVAFAEPAYDADAEDRAASPEEAAAMIGPVPAGVAVLVKASRVAGLERLAELLVASGQPPS